MDCPVPSAFVRESCKRLSLAHVIALSGTLPDFVVAWPDLSALEQNSSWFDPTRELTSDFTSLR